MGVGDTTWLTAALATGSWPALYCLGVLSRGVDAARLAIVSALDRHPRIRAP